MKVSLWLVSVAVLAGCPKKDGTFAVSWTVAVDGTGSTCVDAGVDRVEVRFFDGFTLVSGPDSYACTDGVSTPVTLPPGDYLVSLSALDKNGTEVDAITLEETIKKGSTTTKDVVFDVGGSPPVTAPLIVSWTVAGVPPDNGCSDIVNGTMDISIDGMSVASVACPDSPQTVTTKTGVRAVTISATSPTVPASCTGTAMVMVDSAGSSIEIACN